MLLGTLATALLGNILACKGTIRSGKGKIRAGQGTILGWPRFLMPPDPLTNFEIQKNCQN